MPDVHINPSLKQLEVPLTSLHEDKKNARRHEKRDLEVLAASLSTHGQQKPIVAMRDGKVIAGNGTLRAAKTLGWDRIACVVYDDEDEAKAAAYAIVDNRSAELSEWDFEALSLALKELPEDLLGGVGFTISELEPIMRSNWEPGPIDPLDGAGGEGGRHIIALSDEQWTTFMDATKRLAEQRKEKVTAADVVVHLAQAWLARGT